MFKTDNKHRLHSNAVKIILENLNGAINVDSIAGKNSLYDISWNGIKIRVKVSKKTKKSSLKNARWFYSLKEKEHRADYFVLVAIEDNKPKGIYAIPSVLAPRRYMTISRFNGNVRYDYFRTTLQDLDSKIMKIEKELPELIKIYKNSQSLEGLKNG
jgi:hypothetical protein